MTAVASVPRSRLFAADFYTWIMLACVLAAFGGFIPTYFGPLAAGKFAANPVVHLHGIVFFTWTLYALFQASLIPAGNAALHRSTGMIGVALATLMVVLGCLAALNNLVNVSSFGAGPAHEAESFTIVPLIIMLCFGVFVALAIAFHERADIHKRLMVVATVSILNAPIARPLLQWVWPPAPGHGPGVWLMIPTSLISYTLIVAGMIYDWRTRGKPHPVYVICLVVLTVIAFAVVPLAETSGWHSIAKAYAGLAGSLPHKPG
jgi:hypothetical protein